MFIEKKEILFLGGLFLKILSLNVNSINKHLMYY